MAGTEKRHQSRTEKRPVQSEAWNVRSGSSGAGGDLHRFRLARGPAPRARPQEALSGHVAAKNETRVTVDQTFEDVRDKTIEVGFFELLHRFLQNNVAGSTIPMRHF